LCGIVSTKVLFIEGLSLYCLLSDLSVLTLKYPSIYPFEEERQQAKHAAAARELDCLSYREGEGIRSMSYGLCKEDPYWSTEDSPGLPQSAPLCLLQSLKQMREKIKPHKITVDLSEDCCEKDVEQEKVDYRKSRLSGVPGITETDTTHQSRMDEAKLDPYMLT